MTADVVVLNPIDGHDIQSLILLLAKAVVTQVTAVGNCIVAALGIDRVGIQINSDVLCAFFTLQCRIEADFAAGHIQCDTIDIVGMELIAAVRFHLLGSNSSVGIASLIGNTIAIGILLGRSLAGVDTVNCIARDRVAINLVTLIIRGYILGSSSTVLHVNVADGFVLGLDVAPVSFVAGGSGADAGGAAGVSRLILVVMLNRCIVEGSCIVEALCSLVEFFNKCIVVFYCFQICSILITTQFGILASMFCQFLCFALQSLLFAGQSIILFLCQFGFDKCSNICIICCCLILQIRIQIPQICKLIFFTFSGGQDC